MKGPRVEAQDLSWAVGIGSSRQLECFILRIIAFLSSNDSEIKRDRLRWRRQRDRNEDGAVSTEIRVRRVLTFALKKPIKVVYCGKQTFRVPCIFVHEVGVKQ